jgi:Protein of unknown function (DUF4238)
MNLQRWNHYLAECYQEGFTDANGQVWVKFIGKSPVRRNPRSVGRRRSLYVRNVNGTEDDRIERFLSHEVETPFASLAQRIKNEREKFSDITAAEQAALLKFVASQAVRTLGHRHCVDIQAGWPVDGNTFLRVMMRQMWTMADIWLKNPPKLRFFTTLPYIGERFISGDHPVVVIHVRDNPVWVPTDDPKAEITQLSDLLTTPNCGFWVPLSPYICVSVQPQDGVKTFLPPEPLEPPQVRMFNQLLRGQSRHFILARDKESLN